jgi:hypothetical protein
MLRQISSALLCATLVVTPLYSAPVGQATSSKGAAITSPISILGKRYDFVFSKDAIYRLHFIDEKHLDVTVIADPSYKPGTVNHFESAITEIRPDVYIITWIEPATGNTVTHIDNFVKNIAYTNITDLASKAFWRMKGEIRPVKWSQPCRHLLW